MSRPVAVRLDDLVGAIDAIRSHESELEAVGIGRSRRVRLDAVVRQLAVVAECASHLPDELVAREPTVPWRDVRGIRIVLDHGYHRVDAAVVWRTVDDDLQPLRDAAGRLRRYVIDSG